MVRRRPRHDAGRAHAPVRPRAVRPSLGAAAPGWPRSAALLLVRLGAARVRDRARERDPRPRAGAEPAPRGPPSAVGATSRHVGSRPRRAGGRGVGRLGDQQPARSPGSTPRPAPGRPTQSDRPRSGEIAADGDTSGSPCGAAASWARRRQRQVAPVRHPAAARARRGRSERALGRRPRGARGSRHAAALRPATGEFVQADRVRQRDQRHRPRRWRRVDRARRGHGSCGLSGTGEQRGAVASTRPASRARLRRGATSGRVSRTTTRSRTSIRDACRSSPRWRRVRAARRGAATGSSRATRTHTTGRRAPARCGRDAAEARCRCRSIPTASRRGAGHVWVTGLGKSTLTRTRLLTTRFGARGRAPRASTGPPRPS